MRLPSIERMILGLLQTVSRFPFETLTAITGSCSFYYLVTGNSDYREVYTKLTLTAALGLVMYLSVGLFTRSMGKGNVVYYAGQFLVTGLLTAYYFSLPQALQDTDMQQYAILSSVFHLAVSFAPFLLHKQVDAFWHYNKILFLRIYTAGLYSTVLFGGLAGVLGSLNALFGISINSDTYVILGCTVFGVFNTLFFLAGIPSEPNQAHQNSDYPKGLLMFTQFVLVPLVSIYMFILFAYEIKIVFTLNLPKGWISSLIIAFSIVGILANLLVYPLRNSSDQGWIRFFARWFYLLMFPLLALFYWAILYRINAYGFTEERYYLLVTAIWLTGIGLYMVFSAQKNILFIPVTLAVIGLFSLYGGPLKATSVSLRSQLGRLAQLVNSTEIKTDGNKQQQAVEIMQYCIKTHGYETMIPLFGEKAQTIMEGFRNYNEARYRYVSADECRELLALNGIEYVSAKRTKKPDSEEEIYEAIQALNAYFSYKLNNKNPLRISGFNYVEDLTFDEEKNIQLPWGDNIEINTRQLNTINIKLNGKPLKKIDLNTHIKQIESQFNNQQLAKKNDIENGEANNDQDILLNQEQVTFPIKISDKINAEIVYTQIHFNNLNADTSAMVSNWYGKLLIK